MAPNLNGKENLKMLVKCIDNSNWKDYLTVGKLYEVREEEESRYWLKSDDLDNSFHYHKSYFEKV